MDMVLTESEAIVIEVNPRLTTAYLGVRAALQGRQRGDTDNIAAMALAACAGALTTPPPAKRRVRFSADGVVTATTLRASTPRRR